MQVSYKWLNNYVQLTVPAEELADKLTFAGVAVEEVLKRGYDVKRVVVGQVLEKATHPASDHLSVCKVSDGKDYLTVVCGAPNVAAGQKVALAKIGAELPGDVIIGNATLAGVASQGMLCSGAELGIDETDNKGILVLPEDAPLGADIVEYLDFKDEVMVMDLTPNRADCQAVINVAREAAAVTGGNFVAPIISYIERGHKINEEMAIEVEDFALCPRYVGRLICGVKIGPSPLWLQNYLLAAGQRPINNVVDISNFVLQEMGQPLHTFDYQKLTGQKVIIRAARDGEKIVTLDEKERDLVAGDILICDGENRPVCIAGVMGGLDSEVTEETTDIFIESACFNPVSIRRTSRRLGLFSESSSRFEKGIDRSCCDKAARRACQLILELAGGVASQGLIDIYQDIFTEKQVNLRLSKVNDRLGSSYTVDEVADVMKSLSFPVIGERDGNLLVTVPSYRPDITIEADLIEEVARLRGYDEIPTTVPSSATQGSRSENQQKLLCLRNFCADFGLREVVNYSFISPKEWDKLLLSAEHKYRKTLNISNPLSEEQSIMRTTLLAGLLGDATRNTARRNLDVALFEIGAAFYPKNESQPDEVQKLGVLLVGEQKNGWQGGTQSFDYFFIKGFVEQLCRTMRIDFPSFAPIDPEAAPFMHPGRSARIRLDGKEIGFLGELHPVVIDNYDLEKRSVVLEIETQPLLDAVKPILADFELPKYPAVTRDIAVIGSAKIPAEEICEEIRRVAGPLLTEVKLFDLYDRLPIPHGQRSLAFSLVFRDNERTLVDSQINDIFTSIVNELESKWGLKLR